MTTWSIDSTTAPRSATPPDSSAVPLKWAHDAKTGDPRYIHDAEVVGQLCSCTCPACNLPLTPVMPGQPLRVRPTAHFRHPAGSQKNDCSLVAARLAATRRLHELGVILLPRRQMSRTAQGFSGTGYDVWVEEPSERVVVVGAELRAKQRQLEAEIDQHPFTLELQQRLANLRRPRLLATPATQWASQYLAAAMTFHDANTRIRTAWRDHRGNGLRPPLLGPDSEPWSQLMEAAEALAAHGMPGAADTAMLSETGLVPRILSIQLNRGVGYAVATGFQVLNAIMQSGADNKRWDTLFSIAVKAYGLEAQFTTKQADKYGAWRQTLIEKVDAGDANYLRPVTYDAVLSALFPGMARGIATGYGRHNTDPQLLGPKR